MQSGNAVKPQTVNNVSANVDVLLLMQCPITLRLFLEPITTPCGHTFEKEALLEWCQTHDTCPSCKQMFPPRYNDFSMDNYKINILVRDLIHQYIVANPALAKNQYCSRDYIFKVIEHNADDAIFYSLVAGNQLQEIAVVALLERANKKAENNLEAALKDCEFAICLDPKNDLPHAAKAKILKKQNKLLEALAAIDAAIEINPYRGLHYTKRFSIKRRLKIDASTDFVSSMELFEFPSEIVKLHTELDGKYDENKITNYQNGSLLPYLPHIKMAFTLFDIDSDFQQTLTSLIEIHEPSLHACNFKFRALCLLMLNDYEAAIVAALEAIKFKQNYGEAMVVLADIHSKKGDYKQALTYIEDQLRLSPKDVKSLRLRAKIKMQMNLPDAEEDLLQAHELEPDNKKTLLELVLFKTSINDHRAVIKYISKLISIDNKEPAYFVNRAESRLLIGDEQGAILDANMAIELSPENYQSYIARSILFSRLERYEESISDIKKAYQLNPSSTEAICILADLYWRTKDYQKCLETLNLLPNDFKDPILCLRGSCHYFLKNFDQAILELTKSLENIEYKNSDFHYQGYYHRAIIYNQMNQLDKCLLDIEELLSRGGQDIDVLILKANVLMKQDKPDEALAICNVILELDATIKEVLQLRLNILITKKDYKTAITDATTLISLDDQAEYYVIRGMAHLKIGELANAKRDLELAIVKGHSGPLLDTLRTEINTANAHLLQVHGLLADRRDESENPAKKQRNNSHSP